MIRVAKKLGYPLLSCYRRRSIYAGIQQTKAMRFVRTFIPLVLLLLAQFAAAEVSEFDQAIALHRSGQVAQAVPLLSRLAEAGDVNAQAYLGAMYGSGDGVPRDFQLALKWQRAAATKGHVLAQYNTAVLLARGDKNERSMEEAAKWFQQAGEAGLPQAQLHMGLMHEKGWGTIRCPYEASKWYYRAGITFLAQDNVTMAVHARDNILRLLPDYTLATQLSDEIFLHGSVKR
jgi:TPR repeat protein